MSDFKLSGLGLIEASAGTGKTYTIQNLFFMLIAGCADHPEGFPLESILVVTFTEAATMELKERIRQILVYGMMYFENPELLKYGSGSPGKSGKTISGEYQRIDGLVAEARQAGSPGQQEQRNREIEIRIRKALISFDNAMIFTIHGFCQRMLQQYAFDSGLLFNTEFRGDAAAIDELQDDYLRQLLYPEHRPLYQALLEAAGGKSGIVKNDLCRKVISRPDLQLTETGCTDIPRLLRELESLLEKLRDDYSPDKLPPQCRAAEPEFERWRGAGGAIADSATGAVLDMLVSLAEETPQAENESDYMKKIRELQTRLDWFVRVFPYYVAVQIKERFEKLKQKENFQTFDDLLQRMKGALTGPGGKSISGAIRKQFDAVFVDEFQDTDPVQYDIFRILFGDPATGHILFFVGDPKQAIYSFRGGDIATYRRAKDYIQSRNARNICSLDKNYRSATLLVDAVNRIFGKWQPPEGYTGNVFADPSISFDEVKSDNGISSLTSADGRTDPQPLKFCWAGQLPDKAKEIRKRIMSLCVAHIEKLLASGWMIPADGKTESRKLRPGDIAVLVPRNADATNFRAALNKRNIPCVVAKAENVFKTPAAKYLETVLSAVLSCSDRQGVIEAMTTPLLGYSPEQIRGFCLKADFSVFDSVQDSLMRLNQFWEQNGFLKCFQVMLTEFKVREKLLKFPTGGRILTDLMQLQEQLHLAELENGYEKEGLLIFLTGEIKREDDADPPEPLATRMETDRSAVVLMTLHKSKGLEFPVVMLPFMFDKSWGGKSSGPVFYHDDEGYYCLSLDPRPDPEILKQKMLEEQQEAIRVLYVGLTRAKYACFLYWCSKEKKEDGKKKSRKSAKPEPAAPEAPRNSLEWIFPDIWRNGFTPGQFYPQLEDCEILTDENISVPETNPPEDKTDTTPLTLPEWKRQTLFDRFQYTSFSTLAADDAGNVSGDAPPPDSDGLDYDDDDGDGSGPDLSPPKGIFTMPSGNAVGNAWHKILEKIDFTAFDPDRGADRDLVEQELESFGILRRSLPAETRQEYIDLTLRMIRQVLNAPLNRHAGPPFTLDQIPMADRLIELKFNYAFRHPVEMNQVRDVLSQYARENFGVDTSRIHSLVLDGGYLNGAIDLLFRRNGKLYIADWKSNRITGDISGFDQAGLTGEIAKHTYFLQYLIYTLAAMKYLGLHLGRTVTPEDYDRYFGGVYYLFLRGIDPDIPQQGVFFSRPAFELIRNLDQHIG